MSKEFSNCIARLIGDMGRGAIACVSGEASGKTGKKDKREEYNIMKVLHSGGYRHSHLNISLELSPYLLPKEVKSLWWLKLLYSQIIAKSRSFLFVGQV